MEIHEVESKISKLEEKEETLMEKVKNATEQAEQDKAIDELDSTQKEIAKLSKTLTTLEAAEKRLAEKAKRIAPLADHSPSDSEQKEEAQLKTRVSEDFGKESYKFLMTGKSVTGAVAEMHQMAEEFDQKSHEGIAIPGSWLSTKQDTNKAIIDQANSGLTPLSVGDSYVEAIRETAIYPNVGATVYENLSGEDFGIPVSGKITAAHASAENANAADGGAQMSLPKLQAQRITTYADLSNKINLQNGEIAMNAVMFEIGAAVAETMNDAMFPTTTLSNAPTALAATSGVGTFTEAGTYAAPSNTTAGSISADMVKAIVELTKADALQGNLAFVANPELMNDLINAPGIPAVTTALNGSRPGNTGQNFRGFPIYFTNSATASAGTSGDFIFGNFRKVHVGFFGSLVIQRDMFTQNIKDVTRLVAHRYYDFKLVQGAAFIKATSLSA